MSKHAGDRSSLSRLLRRKRSLGLSAAEPTEPEQAGDSTALTTCINCGYSQQGQVMDRCPECGLLWPSSLREKRHLPGPRKEGFYWRSVWICRLN